MIEVLLLPLTVLAAALNVSDEGVEGDGVMVVEGGSKGEVGAELEAAVAVVAGFLWGVGDEQEDKDCNCYVYDY